MAGCAMLQTACRLGINSFCVRRFRAMQRRHPGRLCRVAGWWRVVPHYAERSVWAGVVYAELGEVRWLALSELLDAGRRFFQVVERERGGQKRARPTAGPVAGRRRLKLKERKPGCAGRGPCSVCILAGCAMLQVVDGLCRIVWRGLPLRKLWVCRVCVTHCTTRLRRYLAPLWLGGPCRGIGSLVSAGLAVCEGAEQFLPCWRCAAWSSHTRGARWLVVPCCRQSADWV